MTGNEYQVLAMRTNDRMATERLVESLYSSGELYTPVTDLSTIPMYKTSQALNACLGLSGEVGEFNDLVKKGIFHETQIEEEHLKKELGDVLWYVALMCDSFGWDLDEIMQLNIDKLKARYPDGFDVELANNRKEGDV